MRLLKILSLVSVVIVVSVGCWDAQPVEKRRFVIAIGVDWLEEEPHYEITFVNPLLDETRSKQALTRTLRANSLAEAIAMSQHTGSQFMSFGILSVLVIGEEAASQRQCFTINDLYAFPDLRPNAYIVVAKGTAKELLSIVPPENQRVGLYIRDVLARADSQRDSPPTTLHQFVLRMMTPGMDAITTLMGSIGTLDPRPPAQATTDGGTAGGEQAAQGGEAGGEPAKKEDVEIMGAAIWRGDAVVGEITLPESQHLTLAQGAAKGMLLQMLFAPDDRLFPEASRMVVMVERAPANWDLTMINGAPHFRVKINIQTSLQNYQGTIDLSKLENSKTLEQIMALEFEQNVLAVLQKVSAMGSDPLRLGQQVRVKYPELWDPVNWSEVIKGAQFKVECEVKIRNIGPQTLRLEPVNKLPPK